MNEDSKKALKIVNSINKIIPQEFDKLKNFNLFLEVIQKFYPKLKALESESVETLEHYFSTKDVDTLILMSKFNALICTSRIELYTHSKNILLFDNEWEVKIYIKNAYLVIFELINTINDNQAQLKTLIDQTNSYSIMMTFLEAGKRLGKFRKKYDTKNTMRKIRNSIAGHFSFDFTEYYKIMESLNPQTVFHAIDEFIQTTLSFEAVLSLLTEHYILQNKPFPSQQQELWEAMFKDLGY